VQGNFAVPGPLAYALDGYAFDPIRISERDPNNRIAPLRLISRDKWSAPMRDGESQHSVEPLTDGSFAAYPCKHHPIGRGAPPWATDRPFDMAKGTIRWQIPFGLDVGLRDHQFRTAVFHRLGVPITTEGGLVFIAAPPPAYRAFNSDNGNLWDEIFPAPEFYPMTYAIMGTIPGYRGGGNKVSVMSLLGSVRCRVLRSLALADTVPRGGSLPRPSFYWRVD